MIELDHNALFFALKKEAFHSSLLDMELGGKTEQVLLRDYQMHPFRPIVLHIDFQRVDATTKVTKKVPLHYVNEENSVAVKTDGCVVNHVVNELNIQCLASQLPEFITVDLGNLTKGQSLHVSDIQLGAGIKVVTQSGWFAARPSGTEDVYKLYAESFQGEQHLERIFEEAQQLVDAALER